MTPTCFNRLKELLEELTRASVSSCGDAEADEVHAELMLYDTYVAGIASSVASGQRVSLDQLQPDVELGRRIVALSSRTGPASAAAVAYRRHYELLVDVLRAVSDVLGGPCIAGQDQA